MLYLHRIGVLDWLPEMFGEIWIPGAVVNEFAKGRRRGYEVPEPANHGWLRVRLQNIAFNKNIISLYFKDLWLF